MLVSPFFLPLTIATIAVVICAGFWANWAYAALNREVQRVAKEKELLQNLFPAMAQASSVDTALDIALSEICQRTGWVVGEAWVPAEDGQRLTCRVWYCNSPESPVLNSFRETTLGLRFSPEEGLPGRVWARGKTEWLQDVSTLQDSIFRRNPLANAVGLKAALALPISHQDQVLAILVFFMMDPRMEDRGLVALLESIALQLGNVLQQKQIEAALRDAEMRYRSIFENAIEGIFQTSEVGNYLAVNPALAKIYGFESSQDLIQGLEDISRQLYVQSERRQEFVRLMESEGAVYQFESQVYRKDGEIIWISETARSVQDENGNLIYYEGTVEDITIRKQAEDSLRKSEAKNRALLNIIPDTIIRLDAQGYCLDFIPAVVESSDLLSEIISDLTEGNPQTIVGQPIDRFLPVEAVISLKAHITETLETGKVSVFEYQTFSLQREQQDYEVRVMVSDLEEVLVIIRDITDRKRMERLKNEFVSMVSHELRTPLTSVKGSLGLIMGGAVGDVSPQVKALVDIALKNSERLILIINDILDIEKIESGKMDFKMQTLDLSELVNQAILANQGYGDQFKISYILDQKLTDVQVYGDSDRLNQVLLNLLSNAAKFSPPHSSITITIDTPKTDWVRISVQDQGAGIPESFRGRIFQKFAQADSSDTRKKGGTGLGLSISKAIVERHQGQIGFFCPESGGTIFYFDLPQVPPAVSPCTDRPAPSPICILICEDDPDIANLLSLMLREGGMASDIAYTAAEAKLKLASRSYVAMTLDLALPGQDGISLIRELRQQEATATLPIVVVSAKAQQGQEDLRGNSFKVIDWLDKPIDQNRLMLSLRQALHQRSSPRPRILHVENDVDILQVVAAILQETVDIVQAQNVQIAQEKLKYEDFDLVILDLDLPDGSGLELLPTLYYAFGSPIPVVIFSAQDIAMDSIHQVAATLVKSRTSNQGLLDTITALISPPMDSVSHLPQNYSAHSSAHPYV